MALFESNPNPLFKEVTGSQLDGTSAAMMNAKYSGQIQEPDYDVESQLLRGTMCFSKDKLKELDPSYVGYTHIFVLRMPPFMKAVANGNFVAGFNENNKVIATRHCKNLKALIELGSTSYSGTPDLTLNTAEVNTGFSERSYPAPTFSQYDGKNFTIRCLETRGEPLRRAVEWYINGISDANVKATMLQGATDSNGNPMEPTLANYTFSIMVVQTDQTLRYIQDISIWNSCIITFMERSTLDWDNGTIDIIQPLDLQFTGVYMPDTNNPLIKEKASQLMAQRLRYYLRYQDMNAKQIGADAWTSIGTSL